MQTHKEIQEAYRAGLRRDRRKAAPWLALLFIVGITCLLLPFCGCASVAPHAPPTPKQTFATLHYNNMLAASQIYTAAVKQAPGEYYREATVTVTVHLCGPTRFQQERKRLGHKDPRAMAFASDWTTGRPHIWIQGGPVAGELFIPQTVLGHELSHVLYMRWGVLTFRLDHLWTYKPLKSRAMLVRE